jgi:hypothetical protein
LGDNAFTFVFELFELMEAARQLFLSFFFLDGTLADGVHSFSVDEVAGSWPPSELAVDTLPMLFEIRLDVF